MISVCGWCKTVLEVKPPFEDKSETHGICGSCLNEWKLQGENAIKDDDEPVPNVYYNEI